MTVMDTRLAGIRWRCPRYPEGPVPEPKSQCGFGYASSRKETANRVYSLAVLAYNLARELQMAVRPPSRRATAKRSALWAFTRGR